MVMCVCFYFSGWHCKLCWNTSLCMVGEWSVNCNWKHISTEQQPYSVLCDVRGKVTLCCNNYGQRWLTVNSWLFNNLQGVSMRIWINIAGLENPISILSNVWGGFSPLEESCFYVQLTCSSFQGLSCVPSPSALWHGQPQVPIVILFLFCAAVWVGWRKCDTHRQYGWCCTGMHLF